MVHNPQCLLCLRRQQQLELVVIFLYSKPPQIIWGQDTLTNWNNVSLNVQFRGETILSVALDGERNSIIVLVEVMIVFFLFIFNITCIFHALYTMKFGYLVYSTAVLLSSFLC